MSAEGEVALLKEMTDKVVGGVKRVRYVNPDGSLGESGPLEITLSDGQTVVTDAGSDGEMLSVSRGAWKDPFREPLSAENEAYIREVGKWTEFDVSTKSPYASLVGERIVSVEPGCDDTGRLITATLRIGAAQLAFSAGADELIVTIDGSEA